ncbi:MAG TPA: carboxypeptidase regulatory-like domain-containing protein [Terriglobia bacterium]|nr:carboxypeptidase regulatory-like domain-containing protein [Terriglobia bacterium]
MRRQRAGWRILGLFALSSALTLLGTVHLFAQVDTGSVLGTITDQSGAVIPGAKVTLTDEGKGFSITTTTGADGSYSFTPVKVAMYTVTAEMAGFEKISQVHVTVSIQQHVVVNLTLKPGRTTQVVEVTGAPPQLQTTEASVGQVVGSRTVEGLPLNGRNFTFLAQIVAGVNTPEADTRGNAASGAFSANGERPAQNNYLLDGIDNNSNTIDFLNGTNFVVLPPVDAIQEFKVQTSDYSAEQGRAGGAILNATVKSGTNDLHGNFWEFFRNDKLDAADFFEDLGGIQKGEFRLNQFGATVGGPVVIPHAYNGRNKLFFFGDYEGTRRRQGSVFSNSVPTALQRASGYTNLAELITLQTGNANSADALNRVFPFGTVFDPATTRPVFCGQADPVTGLMPAAATPNDPCYGIAAGAQLTGVYIADPFYGPNGTTPVGNMTNFTNACPSANACLLNQLPMGRLDPNAIKLLNLYPAAQLQGLLVGNQTSNPNLSENRNGFDTRIDFNANDKNQIFGRFSFVNDPQFIPGPFGGIADGGAFQQGAQTARSDQGAIGWTRSLSPTAVNEARIGLTYIHTSRFGPEGTTFGIPAQFGIQDVPQVTENGGLPAFSIGGLSTLGTNAFLPSDEVNSTVQVTDNFSKAYGKHSFKMGFEFQHIKFSTLQPSWSHGQFDFNGTYSGQGISQLLLTPIAATVPTGVDNVGGTDTVFTSNIALVDDVHNYYGTYLQDDWKITPKLMLNLGLRYEHFGLPEEVHGRQANFVPGVPFSTAAYLVPDSQKNRNIFATFDPSVAPNGFTAALGTDGIALKYDKNWALGDAQNQNFAPRFGFAYQATPKLVVRGGFGVFYGGFEVQNGNNQGNSFPYQFNFGLFSPNSNTPITVPGLASAPAGCTQAYTFELGFACTPLDPSLVPGFGVGLTGLQTNFQTPYSEGWNMAFEYAFAPSVTLTMAYVGNSTHHLELFKGTNQPSQILPPNTCLEAPACPGQNPGNISYVPFPDFSTGQTYQTTDGNSYYHGLQTTLEKRYSSGLSLLATYTWSRCRGDAADLLNGTAIGSYRAVNVPGAGIKYDYGDCDFDIRHVVHFSGAWELPVGQGKKFLASTSRAVDLLVGGWSTQWIATVEGGQPITLTCPDGPASGVGCYDFTIPGVDRHGSGAPYHFLNSAAFTQPCPPPGFPQPTDSQGHLQCIPGISGLGLLGGTASQVSGPAISRVDFSMFKTFRLSERFKLQFRSEFFNILNHPTFNAPGFGGNGVIAVPGSTDFRNTAFGQIGSTRFPFNDPRQIQFALKLYY